jgi:ethanolamine utilization microcompartment shell protein EutL
VNPDLDRSKPTVAVEVVGRIYRDQVKQSEQVLGTVEGDNPREVALMLDAMLTEIADTWPQVVGEGAW